MQKAAMIGLAAGLALGSVSAPAAAFPQANAYNGTWKVRLVTESGTCDSSYNQTIAIENGRVRPLAGESGTAISGGVGNDGNVAISIHRSLARAEAAGRRGARPGGGRCTLARRGCTGHGLAAGG
jgi:hypothetical protein